MARRNSKMLPQRHTNKGEPAAGAGHGVSFDQATSQQALMRMVFSRIGDLARGRPGGLDRYPAVMPNYGGQGMPKGRGVTSGDDRQDVAVHGAHGGRTGRASYVKSAETVGISPSVVMSEKRGVATSRVPSALAGRRRKRG